LRTYSIRALNKPSIIELVATMLAMSCCLMGHSIFVMFDELRWDCRLMRFDSIELFGLVLPKSTAAWRTSYFSHVRKPSPDRPRFHQ
jgi:hypothetical protein